MLRLFGLLTHDMITEIVGNLLDTDKCDVIVHQANLFHTFGAGIAKAIREKFPEAFEADKNTNHGDINKLGRYSSSKITDTKGTTIKYIVNLYSQNGIGGKDRHTSYDCMVDGLKNLRDKLENGSAQRVVKGESPFVLGIPFQMGCGFANGDWTIVRAIIESIFGKSTLQVYIYTLPELVKK